MEASLQQTAVAPDTAPSGRPVRSASPGWLYFFLITQVACQLLLIAPGIGPIRLLLRIAAFAIGLLFLALMPGPRKATPTSTAAVVAISIVGLSILNPSTNSTLGGLAQIGMYVAIFSPVFWVARIKVETKTLEKLLLLLWCFHLVSCVFGVLQVYFPGRFQPEVSSVLRSREDYLDSLHITLDSGERVFRPMGLTDIPGGVGMAGLYALLLGSGFLLSARRLSLRLLYLGGMGLGAVCLYLCQVRAMAVTAAICLAAAGARFFILGRMRQAIGFAAVIPTLAVLAFGAAISLGGKSVLERFASLQEGSAGEVYYANRGFFLEDTLSNLLPEYPLGAGLARYGMMLTYFGDPSSRESPPIYAEIQWTAWTLDGGIPLILAYVAAIGFAVRNALRVSRLNHPRERTLSNWAAVLLGYNVGIFALTFSYIPFMAQLGMEFWLLNTALATAATRLAVQQELATP